jgi:1,2-diacylglycerol 3-alpha-glucosyltransferase
MYEDYTHYVSHVKYAKKFVKKFIIQSSKTYVKRYNAIIAPTDKTKNALQNYGIKNDIFVVPTGISLEQFKCHPKDDPVILNLRKSLGLSQDQKIILSLGRISEEKSVDKIIMQMNSIKEIIPNVVLLIVGDGPYREKLENLSNRLGLDDNIIFTGGVPWEDVSYYYSMADVFVSASKTETQGLTIMEAMASKIPVVVYDDDNVKNVIFDRVSGRLFSTDEQLVKCIIDILSDTEKSNQIAETGHMIIQSLSKEQFGENAEKVYSSLVASNRPVNLSAM